MQTLQDNESRKLRRSYIVGRILANIDRYQFSNEELKEFEIKEGDGIPFPENITVFSFETLSRKDVKFEDYIKDV